MFQIEKTTQNLLLLAEYSNPQDFEGELISEGKTYLLFSKLSEKLLRRYNAENLQNNEHRNVWYSNLEEIYGSN